MRACVTAISLVVMAFAIGACGSQGVEVQAGASADVERGAQLFSERCSGCHQLDAAGAEGGALKVGDREKLDGPNFNVRKETKDQVLYAIRNGGFSGALMPENIVVGQDAQDVATFLAEYAGKGEGN